MSCNVTEAASYESIAANLDGMVLISHSSFPYFMLIVIEGLNLLRGLVLLLPFTLVIIAYFFFFEALGIQIPIFISFSDLKIRDKCKKSVVVTANLTVIVESFMNVFLGGDTNFSGGIRVGGIGVAE